jgi:hypothetical protein
MLRAIVEGRALGVEMKPPMEVPPWRKKPAADKTAKPEKPAAKPEKPAAKPEKPAAKPEKPAAKPEKPLTP